MDTVPAKTILQRKKASGEWFGQDFNMNIYRGCNHGCIYCDSRSSCYQIENFGKVRAKENALAILGQQLQKSIKRGVVGTGAMSDPYNSFENEEKLTRNSLELLNAYEFGISIATKSDLITRDIDILRDIKEHSPVICKLTITSPYDELSKKIEPAAPVSSRRFQALARLHEAGIFCGILLMPVLPFIQDSNESILKLIKYANEGGVNFIYPSFGLTMRQGQREYFYAGLDKAFPDEKYSLKYQNKYGNNYYCSSPRAKQLWKLFTNECDKLGILYKMQDIIAGYKQGYGSGQLSFY